MTTAELNHDLKELLKLAQLPRAQIQPRLFMAKAQMLAAQLEDESVEVAPEVFAILDNDGRRMCLTALLTILAAAAGDVK